MSSCSKNFAKILDSSSLKCSLNFQRVDELIREKLLPRYKPYKLHELGTLKAIEDYLRENKYDLPQRDIDECRLSQIFLRCREPYVYVGRKLMALQLLEIYSKVTSDLGTFLYHYLERTKSQLWPPMNDCHESRCNMEEDRVNKEIRDAHRGTVVEHETPEELCQGLPDSDSCRESLSKYCDLATEGKYCGEELGWLLQGQSKVYSQQISPEVATCNCNCSLASRVTATWHKCGSSTTKRC